MLSQPLPRQQEVLHKWMPCFSLFWRSSKLFKILPADYNNKDHTILLFSFQQQHSPQRIKKIMLHKSTKVLSENKWTYYSKNPSLFFQKCITHLLLKSPYQFVMYKSIMAKPWVTICTAIQVLEMWGHKNIKKSNPVLYTTEWVYKSSTIHWSSDNPTNLQHLAKEQELWMK